MEMEQKRIPLLQAMGYSDKAIQYILNKTNVGEIPSPTVSAKNQGTCGDIMILYLTIEQNIITEAKYDYIGCAGLQAAASALTEMIKGQTVKNAQKIESSDILSFLGGLPEQKHECALLASTTLKKALETFFSQN
ncbi:MAG: iron-sulfur cluster assembly scaffold protein [bacterium]|nr:MAG: iron-sulfur cluster assembly scaffold protein [bacterium]